MRNRKSFAARYGALIVVGVIVLLLLMGILPPGVSIMTSVPDGHTGILTSYGKVENTYLRHKVMTEAEDETEPIYRLEEFLFLQPHSFNMTVFSDRRSIIVLHQSLPHSMISSSVTL